jgi:uncharacterized protein YegP (UPF0339 family)
MLKFVVAQERTGKYRWNCYAHPGGNLARSGESYTVKSDCVEAINRVISMLPAHAEVEVEETFSTAEALTSYAGR